MKNFLFKPNPFKEILRELLVIPSFAIGWFTAELFKESPHPSVKICVIIIAVGALWASWGLAYVIMKSKN